MRNMGKPECKSATGLRSVSAKSRPITKAKAAVAAHTSTNALRSSANIRVVVRTRPPNQRELEENNKIILKLVDEQLLIFDPKTNATAFFYHGVEQKRRDLLKKANKDLQFTFDRVFGFDCTNQEVFENTTKDLINSLMDGYNCSVFAYGATGAGKTHTMIGHNDNPGITYLTIAELFKAKENLQDERNFELGISYIEVYNETVQDLLNPGAPLQLRDDGRYGVMVAGIKVHKIQQPDELFTLLAKGNGNRTQHPTDANAESSRSHAVFQVYIQMELKATREVRASKLSMIDLAGSERGSATGYGGARFAEGANINKSLLALGNCINSLADGQKYVPYRDSKLTRLLKDSLGGNCQTVMIANVSPSSLSYEDTYNTLKYATRAKKIKSQVKKNVVSVELHAGEYAKIVEELNKEVESLKNEVKTLKAQPRGKGSEPMINEEVVSLLNRFVEERRNLIERMFNVECSENMFTLRRHLKENADARVSDLGTDTPEKDEAHRRLGNTVNRLTRQEDTLKNELTEMKLAKLLLENRSEELAAQHPEMKSMIDLENEKLRHLETENQLKLIQKKYCVLEEDLKTREHLHEKTRRMLQTCYLQLKGHGFASDLLCQQYQALAEDLQDRKHITWDSPVDSGISSTTSIASNDENRPLLKRKMNDDNIKAIPLNGTFVADSHSPRLNKVKFCAEELMSKEKSPIVIKKKRDVTAPPKESKRLLHLQNRQLGAISKFGTGVKRPPFRT